MILHFSHMGLTDGRTFMKTSENDAGTKERMSRARRRKIAEQVRAPSCDAGACDRPGKRSCGNNHGQARSSRTIALLDRWMPRRQHAGSGLGDGDGEFLVR